MKRTHIQLTEKQAETLRRLASRHGVSMAEIVRRLVDTVAEPDLPPNYDELAARALAAAGSIHSDITDMSVRHDEYLAGAWGLERQDETL